MEALGTPGGSGRPSRATLAAIAIGLVAFTLGVVGYLRAGGVSVATAVYDTLLLFTLNFVPPPDTGQSLPVALEIARFLAPVVTLLAAVGLAARLFRDEFDRVTTRRRAHGHVIVCGLGHVGSTAVGLLRTHGHRVVAIERDRSSAAIPVARSLGVPVVVGDARTADTLERAGIARAANLIWSIGDFVEGRMVVTSAAEALRGQRPRHRRDDRPASCRLRVRDLGLCELLRRDVLVGHGLGSQEPDVDFFNEWENTAQRLLWNVMRGYALSDDDVDLWIVGGGPLAEALALQAVRNWWGLPASRRRARLSIHFFDDDAGGERDRFAAVWPEAAASCTITAHDGPPELALAYGRATGTRRADAAFVLVDGRDRTLELGLRLSETRCSERVAVAVSGSTGDDMLADVTVFDPVNFGLDSDILLLDTYDQLARMIHEHYLESRLSPDGAIAPTPDAFHPGHEWTELDPFWQESNRDAARFVVPNLLESGYDIRRRRSATTVLDALDDPHVEDMAQREHERWLRFMTDRGWTCAPGPRDSPRRTNPGLVPWSDADESARAYSCDSVRDYPRLLAQLGYQVRHAAPSAEPSPPATPEAAAAPEASGPHRLR